MPFFKYHEPRPNSKRQQELVKNPKKIMVVGCKGCHNTNTTLYKATDGYYCWECVRKLDKKKFKKKGE